MDVLRYFASALRIIRTKKSQMNAISLKTTNSRYNSSSFSFSSHLLSWFGSGIFDFEGLLLCENSVCDFVLELNRSFLDFEVDPEVAGLVFPVHSFLPEKTGKPT